MGDHARGRGLAVTADDGDESFISGDFRQHLTTPEAAHASLSGGSKQGMRRWYRTGIYDCGKTSNLLRENKIFEKDARLRQPSTDAFL